MGLIWGEAAPWSERATLPLLMVVMTLATMGVSGSTFPSPSQGPRGSCSCRHRNELSCPRRFSTCAQRNSRFATKHSKAVSSSSRLFPLQLRLFRSLFFWTETTHLLPHWNPGEFIWGHWRTCRYDGCFPRFKLCRSGQPDHDHGIELILLLLILYRILVRFKISPPDRPPQRDPDKMESFRAHIYHRGNESRGFSDKPTVAGLPGAHRYCQHLCPGTGHRGGGKGLSDPTKNLGRSGPARHTQKLRACRRIGVKPVPAGKPPCRQRSQPSS